MIVDKLCLSFQCLKSCFFFAIDSFLHKRTSSCAMESDVVSKNRHRKRITSTGIIRFTNIKKFIFGNRRSINNLQGLKFLILNTNKFDRFSGNKLIMLFRSKSKFIGIFLIDGNNTSMWMLINPLIIELCTKMFHTILGSFISFFRSHTFIYDKIRTIFLKISHHFKRFFIQLITSDRRHSCLYIIDRDIKLNLFLFVLLSNFISSFLFLLFEGAHINVIITDNSRSRFINYRSMSSNCSGCIIGSFPSFICTKSLKIRINCNRLRRSHCFIRRLCISRILI